jgi:hypothetical protein
MFVRLTNAKRLKAGWLLALVGMLCLFAPGVSFAFSDGSRSAPFVTNETQELGIVHVHDLSERAPHAPKGARLCEHSATHAHLNKFVPAPANDQTSRAHCCCMMCSSALPATTIDIVRPSAPTCVCASENYRKVIDNTPPRLYRPPIA